MVTSSARAMDLDSFASLGGLYLSTFAVCLVSAVAPLVSAEAYLLAVSVFLTPATLLPVVLLSALGQMSGKTGLYLTGRGVIRLPLKRGSSKLDQLRASLEQRDGRTGALLFVSAFAGVPPFYALSILAGALRFRYALFLAWGLTGRTLRFGLVVLLPQLVKGLIA